MVEFNLSQIIYEEITKHVEKVHVSHLIPLPSLIFQIVQKQNHRIVRATEQLERTVVELKFSQKWLKGKHTFVAPEDQPERE